MKKTNVLGLISNIGHKVSANDDVIKNCEIVIQIVLYYGTSKETYVEIRVRLCNKQKTRKWIVLSPDPCKQAISRGNCQSHHWLHFTIKIFSQLSLKYNGWNYNEQLNVVVPVWFDKPLFYHSIITKKKKKKKKILVGGYEADLENTKKILPSAPKKPRKLKQISVISKKEASSWSKSSEIDDNPMLSVIREEEITSDTLCLDYPLSRTSLCL